MSTNFHPRLYFRCRDIEAINGWVDAESVQGRDRPPVNKPKDTRSSFRVTYDTGWYRWHPGQVEKQSDLPSDCEPYFTTSIFWDQHKQNYWVLGEDCNQIPQYSKKRLLQIAEWQPLQFGDCVIQGGVSTAGQREVLHSGGSSEQLVGINHPGLHFEEIFPKNIFRGRPGDDDKCQIVGRVDLVLAIVAMGVDKTEQIPLYVQESFYNTPPPKHRSEFRSCLLHGQGAPREIGSHPGRGLIVEVQISSTTSTQEDLRCWKNGHYGPMLSSATGLIEHRCLQCGPLISSESSSSVETSSTATLRPQRVCRHPQSAEPRSVASGSSLNRSRQTGEGASQSSKPGTGTVPIERAE